MSWLNKVGEYFDFDLPKRIESHNHFKKPSTMNPMAELFPYRSYLEESSLFINHDSFGFLVEVMPLVGADENSCKILARLFTQGLPPNTHIQIICWASPDVHTNLSYWQESRSKQGEIYQQLAERRKNYLASCAQKPVFQGSPYVIRNFRTFIAIGKPGSPNQSDVKAMESLQQNLLTMLKTMQGPAALVNPEQLIHLCQEWVVPKINASKLEGHWSPFDPINHQIARPDTKLEVSANGIVFNNGERLARSYSAKTFPKYWAQWQMNDLIGDHFNEQLKIPCPFISVLTVCVDDQEKAKTRATLKFSRATKQNTEGASRFVPVLVKQEQDWRHVNQALGDGEKLVNAQYQVILLSDEKTIDSAETNLFALYESHGWKLIRDTYTQLLGFQSAFPFTPSEGLYQDLRKLGRYKTMLSSTCANVAPLQGEWKGMGIPRLLLTGRRGQTLLWDPFSNTEGNYNAAIVGKSGSGKSVFLQELCTGLLGSGAKVFVIDKGRSFMRLAKLLGGTFLEFTQDARLCLNPFSNIQTESEAHFKESLKMLKPLIQTMAKPTQGTTDWENAVIEEALIESWNKHQNATTITHISEWLKSHKDKRAQDIGSSLYPYTASGSYGRFFEGVCNVNLEHDFVVLELEELQGQPELQSVVMLVLMFQITQSMYLGGRKRPIACIIDEAWDLLGGSESAANFIEKGYRQARKYNSSFMTGTQGINDYHKTPAALAAFENSDWLVALSQKKESIQALKDSGRLVMTQAMEKSLKSLHTQQDAYSETLIYGPQGFAIGRLMLDEFSLALYTSKAADFVQIEALIDEGYPVAEAIERYLTQKRGQVR